MITPHELDELERLDREATAGPWSVAGFDSERSLVGVNGPSGYCPEIGPIHGQLTIHGNDQDGILIAEVRNALPALIAAARRAIELEATCTHLMRQVEELDRTLAEREGDPNE